MFLPCSSLVRLCWAPRNGAALLFLCLLLSALGRFFQSCHLCSHPAPPSTSGGTQIYFCLTGQTQLRKSRIKGSALLLHFQTQPPHPDQKVRPVLLPGLLEDPGLRVHFGKIYPESSAFHQGSFLEFSDNSQSCFILLLQTASQWSSSGMQMRHPTPTAQHQPWAKLFASHCAGYGEGGGGLISLSPKMGLLLKNKNTEVTPSYIYSIILMLLHLLDTDLIQWCKGSSCCSDLHFCRWKCKGKILLSCWYSVKKVHSASDLELSSSVIEPANEEKNTFVVELRQDRVI